MTEQQSPAGRQPRTEPVQDHRRGRGSRIEPVGGYERTIARDPATWRRLSRTPEETVVRAVELYQQPQEDGTPRTVAEIARILTREQRPSATGKTEWDSRMAKHVLTKAGAWRWREELDEEGRRRQGRPRRPVPDELLARMARLRDEEGFSLQQIADELNAEGEQTPMGRPWSKWGVNHYLSAVPVGSSGDEPGG